MIMNGPESFLKLILVLSILLWMIVNAKQASKIQRFTFLQYPTFRNIPIVSDIKCVQYNIKVNPMSSESKRWFFGSMRTQRRRIPRLKICISFRHFLYPAPINVCHTFDLHRNWKIYDYKISYNIHINIHKST